MAENIAVTPGSGKTILADEVTLNAVTGIVGYAKLLGGTDNDDTRVAAGGGVEANALRVTIASDSTGVLSVDDNGGSLTVDAVSLPLPTGASTAANQTTIIGHVDDIETLLTTVAGAVSGSEMQVDIVTSTLPTGAATSAKQDTLIGYVDGVEALLTTIAGAVSGSEMQVDVVTSALPTGAATLAEQQTQTASLSVLDDWDESDRAKVNIIVGQAGVAAGSGNVSATTQRVVLAADVNLPLPNLGAVSAGNSRADSSLGGGAVFTGSFEDILQYTNLAIGVYDAGSAGGTLTINWSEDGVNTRDADTVIVPTANGQQFAFGRKWRYLQVIYTHGAAAGNVVIQTIYSSGDLIPSTHFGTDNITTSQDGQLVHAALRAVSGTNLVGMTGDASFGLDVDVTPSSSFDHARTAVGTSAVQLIVASTVAKRGVVVKAAAGNSGIIYVGNSDVTAGSTAATDGFELLNGESIFLEIDNANKIYCIASVTSQNVYWTVI